MWIATKRDYTVLSQVSYAPKVRRIAGHDETYCSRYEGAFLEGLAANCPDPARIVEIGTGRGNSLLRILYGLSLHEDGRVWSIDLCECEEARKCIEKTGVVQGKYTYLVGPSPEQVGNVGEPLDLVYVDGSHSDQGVRDDIEAWADSVKVGGVMAFHDYGNPLHSVTSAIDEMMVDGWQMMGLVGTVIAFEKVERR
jgi:predicted O-methyltransferase YrrM